MSGLSSFDYIEDDDDNITTSNPFASANKTVNDPFASANKTVNDPFAAVDTKVSDPFTQSSPFPTSTVSDPFGIPPPTAVVEAVSEDEKENKNEIASMNVITENEEEDVKEFKAEEQQPIPIIEEKKEEVKEEVEEKPQVTITSMEDSSNQAVVEYFAETFKETFVPQLQETEKEVNGLIEIQVALDQQLNALYQQLKRMESVLNPPNYEKDMQRIDSIRKRIDRLNSVLNQIETRINTLMNSRIYTKCLFMLFTFSFTHHY